MKLLSITKLCYKVDIILLSHTMLLAAIKKSTTLLLLLSLFGQAVASGVMVCKMEQGQKTSHSDCMSNTDSMNNGNTHQQDTSMAHDMTKTPADCTQDCECCLGACSSSTSMPTNLASLNSPSLIKTGYKSLALINRTESLYRPPITC